MSALIGIVIGLAGGIGGTLLGLRLFEGSRLETSRRTRAALLDEARREAEATRREMQIEAREQSVKLRTEIEQEVRDRRLQITKIEERVLAKEEEIDGKLTELIRREQGIADRETHLKALQEEQKAAKEQEHASPAQ